MQHTHPSAVLYSLQSRLPKGFVPSHLPLDDGMQSYWGVGQATQDQMEEGLG